MLHQVLDRRSRATCRAVRDRFCAAFVVAIVVLASLTIATIGCGAARPKGGDFDNARALVVAGKYDEAVTALNAFLESHPNSKNASRAGLFLFKAHLAKGEFDKASKWCHWTVREHPGSLEAHKCRYKLAVLAMLQGQTAEAIKQFGALSDRPDGPLAAEATAMRQFLSEQ